MCRAEVSFFDDQPTTPLPRGKRNLGGGCSGVDTEANGEVGPGRATESAAMTVVLRCHAIPRRPRNRVSRALNRRAMARTNLTGADDDSPTRAH